MAAYLLVSEEILMDEGLIPDTRPPQPPPPLRFRLRYRWWEVREALAVRAYTLIAGFAPPSGDRDD